ncbi:MAG TPA: M23 family metallopeptidase, partial [Longimicrobiaceae bacterium]|nr:M23 family metallopeptidase [Longimicrobiaceae bacterium]
MLPLLMVIVVLAGCRAMEPLRDAIHAPTPYERYAESLRSAGLEETALGRDWIRAGEQALREPQRAVLPLREAGYFPAEEAFAVGYRFRAQRGQRLDARLEAEGAAPYRLFLDLFSVPEDTAAAPRHLASAGENESGLEWNVPRDGEYLLRLQPELLRSGRYTLTVQSAASLAFPVEGRDSRAIGSRFGAPRDGGQRAHHGVDIFAPRGTPVIAASDGIVTRANETARGGRVVWLRDSSRGHNLYYAHLDTQLVASGTRVRAGDTLGTVGNTGNARNTSPHLHFGIYRSGEGPVDPYPFVHTPRSQPPALAADTTRLGEWIRVAAAQLPLRVAPSADAAIADQLSRHTVARALAASGGWYRVVLPDGRSGYVPARSTEPATRPLRQERLAQGGALRDRPTPGAAVMDTLQ